MKYTSPLDETIFVSEIFPERRYMFNHDLRTGLSIIWNTGKEAQFMIDDEVIFVNTNCIIFLTEFHRITEFSFEKMNILQFNRPFFCVQERDNEINCKGLLFFGASGIPKITIPPEKLASFQALWDVLVMEMEEMDNLKLEMLRAMLKRFLILSLRIYKNENHNLVNDNFNIGLIREYNYLVEQHYMKLTKVSDYAKLLHKSPKTLSNLFKKYIDKTPLQIINNRRLLEAKRSLMFTQRSIQEISDDLGFVDVQSFSHFFKKKLKISPLQFRNKPK